MRVVISFLLASMILVSGCSTGSPAGSSTASIPASITGNWALSATSSNTTATSLINTMGGYITSSGGTVTGTIHVVNTSSCYTLAQNIPITGTYSSSSGAFTAVSSAVSGQVITISGTIVAGSVNSAVLKSGTYSVAGGCDNGETGTLTGYTAVSYTSGYLGYFYSGVVKSTSTSTTGTITVTSGVSMTQSSTPDANGFYHVTGSAVFSGSNCTTTAVTTSLSSGTITASTIAGTYVSITITDTNNNVLTFTGYANNGLFGNIINATSNTPPGYTIGVSPCYPSGDYGTATLQS